MSLPWVKLHTGLLDNDRFKEASFDAKLTFYTCLLLAGKLDADGALVIQGWGAMGARHVARYTGLQVPRQTKAISELLRIGFLEQRQDLVEPVLRVTKWSEKAGEESRLETLRERSRRHRRKRSSERSHDIIAVTPLGVQNVTDIDIDKEKDLEAETIVSAVAVAPVGVDNPLPTQPSLPLKDQEEITKARELLDTVWRLLGGLTGTSKSAWAAKGNKAPALDMVRMGVTVEQVTVAWKSASARFGEPVYTMKKIQEEIGRLALVPVQKAKPGSAGIRRAHDRGTEMDETIKELEAKKKAERDNRQQHDAT